MRNEQDIINDIDAAVELYRSNVNNKLFAWTPKKTEENNEKLKKLREELANFYLEGVIVPPEVQDAMIGIMHGMRRVVNKQPVFEIGCTVRAVIVNKITKYHLKAHGYTREEAVAKWNRGEYVTPL